MHRHCWKEHLEISKMDTFEGDILQNSENMVLQSREITDVCMLGGKFVPPSIQTSVKFCDFAVLQDINLQFGPRIY